MIANEICKWHITEGEGKTDNKRSFFEKNREIIKRNCIKVNLRTGLNNSENSIRDMV